MKTTNAWVSHDKGGPSTLNFETVALTSPGAREVQVKVHAVGLNFPDGLLIRDMYQARPQRPFTPGSEFSGIVERVGSEVTQFKPGDAVSGVSGWGAMAERINIAEERLIGIPPGVSLDSAAGFIFSYATAYHALQDVGKIQPGETLLVLGSSGGVGSAIIDIGKALGATVIAGASTEEKLDFAMSYGADNGILYDREISTLEKQQAFRHQINEASPTGIDVVIDPIGGNYAEPALRALNRHGRYLVVGFASGIPRIPLNIPLLKSSSILGVDWRTFMKLEPQRNVENMQTLFRMLLDKNIQPAVTKKYPLNEAPQAIEQLESRKVMGKIIVTVGD